MEEKAIDNKDGKDNKEKKKAYKSLGGVLKDRDFKLLLTELNTISEDNLEKWGKRTEDKQYNEFDNLLFKLPKFASKVIVNEQNGEEKFEGVMCEGVIDCVKKLLELGANPKAWMENGESCFLLACESNCVELVDYLLNNEYDKCNYKVQDANTKNGLHYAVMVNSEKTLDYLLTNFDFNVNDKNFLLNNETLAFFACRFNNKDVMDVLIKHGADLTVKNEKGEKAFEQARPAYDVITQEQYGYKEEEIKKWIPLYEEIKEATNVQLSNKIQLKPKSKLIK